MKFKMSSLLLLSLTTLVSATPPKMSLEEFLNKAQHDFENKRPYDELFELVASNRSYLDERANSRIPSLLVLIGSEYHTAKMAKSGQENLLLRYWKRLVQLGKGYTPFDKQVDSFMKFIKTEASDEDKGYLFSLTELIYDNYPKKYKRAERPKAKGVQRKRFTYVQPSIELLRAGFSYHTHCASLQKQVEHRRPKIFKISCPTSIEACSFVDPKTKRPFICELAFHWYDCSEKDWLCGGNSQASAKDNIKEAFKSTLELAKDDPLFRKQVSQDLYKALLDFDQLYGTVEEVFGGYPADEEFELDKDDLAKRKSAIYTAQLFHAIKDLKTNKAHYLIKNYPELACSFDDRGLSPIHQIFKSYNGCTKRQKDEPYEYNIRKENAKKKRLEALFVHLKEAGTKLDVAGDRWEMKRSFEHSEEKNDYIFVDRWNRVGNHPTVQQLIDGEAESGGSMSSMESSLGYCDRKRKKSYYLDDEAQKTFKNLLSMEREKFKFKYSWARNYLPEPEGKEKLVEEIQEASKQIDPPKKEVLKDPTFLDSWKGTLKFLAVGAVAGAACYYVGKRYRSTPEQLYGQSDERAV